MNPNVMADPLAVDLTDVDLYRDPAAETLPAVHDQTWTPPLPVRGGLYPMRTVGYLTTIEDGPKLRSPLKIEISPTEDGFCEVYSPILEIAGVGERLLNAKQDLCGTIRALWSEYADAPVEGLAPDAVALLKRLRSVLG